jgi:hypothetical protein
MVGARVCDRVGEFVVRYTENTRQSCIFCRALQRRRTSSFFSTIYKNHKIYQIILEKFRKLTKIKVMLSIAYKNMF